MTSESKLNYTSLWPYIDFNNPTAKVLQQYRNFVNKNIFHLQSACVLYFFLRVKSAGVLYATRLI